VGPRSSDERVLGGSLVRRAHRLGPADRRLRDSVTFRL
jgi:hypothetical protein